MIFSIKVADYIFKITCSYEFSKNMCKDYIVSEKPDFEIIISPSDIEYERIIESQSSNNFHSKDSSLEFVAIERKLTELLFSKNVFLMHGVLLSKDDIGYLFIASSGTGKTTHSNNWIKLFKDRVTIINGDKPFIKIKDNIAYAYGTPWCGKELLQVNKKVVLKNIIGLSRNSKNIIKKVTIDEIFPLLYQQSYKSINKKNISLTLNFLSNLKDCVSFYSLGCNMDVESAAVAFKGITSTYSFEDILDMEGKLTYITKGSSMMPLIRQDSDLSILKKINEDEDINVNDVVLYKRDNGQYIMHRVIKKTKNNSFKILGDNLPNAEKGIRRNQILARLIGIDKGNNTYIDLSKSTKYKEYVEQLTKNRMKRCFNLFIKFKYNSLKTKLRKILKNN